MAVNRDGKPIGKSSNNPIVCTQKYLVECGEGKIEIRLCKTKG